MKIISKHKEYYDSMRRDEALIYDRRGKILSLENLMWCSYVDFAICGRRYRIYIEQDELIWSKKRCREKYKEFISGQTCLNQIHRAPVLAIQQRGEFGIPHLTSFKFWNIIGAEQIYQEIVAFLGWMKDNPPAPQITDNKSKIIAAGFDPKTSFRNKKRFEA